MTPKKVFALIGLITTACGFGPLLVAATQQIDRDEVQVLLKSEGQFTRSDVRRVLKASHAAMADQTFRVTLLPNAGGPSIKYDVRMGPGGQPRYLRSMNSWSESLSDYTGRQAQLCSGAMIADELVLDYTAIFDASRFANAPHLFNDWIDDGSGAKLKAGARTRHSHELLGDVFDMFAAERGIAVGRTAIIDGHASRAFVKHSELRPGDYSADPIPPEVQDWLWIDVESLFLVRWEIRNAGVSTDYGYVFTHDPALDVRPPDGIDVSTCIQ